MSGEAVFVHDPSLEDYGFGKDHPFKPVRVRMTIELCEALGLLEGYSFAESEPATDEDIGAVHYTSYIKRVKEAGRGEGDLEELQVYGLGTQDNPIFEGMHEASARVVGATMEACRLVMDGEAKHAFCPSGGLDHAKSWEASGFCIYNDIGVAMARLKEEYPGIKVAYLDTDGHHGDGVQWMFYEDPEVLTISMHETGRRLFLGIGEIKERGQGEDHGYSVNVSLQPQTQDDSFIECFEAVVPEVLRSFGPDLIFSQNGCDAHDLWTSWRTSRSPPASTSTFQRGSTISPTSSAMDAGSRSAVVATTSGASFRERGPPSGPSSPTRSCPTRCPRAGWRSGERRAP